MFDPFFLKNEIHFEQHVRDVNGHYDSAPILTSSSVEENQNLSDLKDSDLDLFLY